MNLDLKLFSYQIQIKQKLTGQDEQTLSEMI